MLLERPCLRNKPFLILVVFPLKLDLTVRCNTITLSCIDIHENCIGHCFGNETFLVKHRHHLLLDDLALESERLTQHLINFFGTEEFGEIVNVQVHDLRLGDGPHSALALDRMRVINCPDRLDDFLMPKELPFLDGSDFVENAALLDLLLPNVESNRKLHLLFNVNLGFKHEFAAH